MLIYHSALTVFLSWIGAVAAWPDLAKKTAVICSEVLLDLLSFTSGPSTGNHCGLLLGFRVILYTKVSLPMTMSQTRSDVLASVKFSKHVKGTTPPYRSSVPRSAGGVSNGRNAFLHPRDDGGSDSSLPMKD